MLLVKTQHFGDLSVSATHITRTGNFGMVLTLGRAELAKIVEATVIDSGRYGPTRTKQLLLIGRDGRCNLIMSAAYDFDRLAAWGTTTFKLFAAGGVIVAGACLARPILAGRPH